MWVRRKLAGAVLGALVVTFSAVPTAGAADPQTLSGAQQQNGIADDPEPASLELHTTFTGTSAQGTLRTVQATDSQAWATFEGEVTCVRQSGHRIVIGAFGHAYAERTVYDEQKEEQVRAVEELPGTYMQVVAFEFGNFEDAYGRLSFYRHAWNTIGSDGEGTPSSAPPSCSGWSKLKVRWIGELGEIGLSPSITAPREAAKVKSTHVTLKGRGEPESTLKVFEPTDPNAGSTVIVGQHGTWSVVRKNLSSGPHEFIAQPQQETGVTEAAHVAFSVDP